MGDVQSDQSLLSRWAENRDESAFAELVKRHAPLVYSAAQRQTRDMQLAQDISQAVFVLVARKAASLRRHTMISGWLYQATRLTAKNAIRMEARRQKIERQAGLQGATGGDAESIWESISPLLDDAMADLSESDRQLVLWRYFENRSHAQTAQLLGITENTAARRFSRVLEKMRSFFNQRGVDVPCASLGTLLGTHAILPAPQEIIASITSAALAGSSALASSTATMLTLAKAKLAGLVLLGAALAGGAGVITLRASSPNAVATSQPVIAPATMPATAPVAAAPATRPARPKLLTMQIVGYQVFIDRPLVDQIIKSSTRIPSSGKKIDICIADAEVIRSLLVDGKQKGTFFGNATRLSFPRSIGIADDKQRVPYRGDDIVENEGFITLGKPGHFSCTFRPAYHFSDSVFAAGMNEGVADINMNVRDFTMDLSPNKLASSALADKQWNSIDGQLRFQTKVPAGHCVFGLMKMGVRDTSEIWYMPVWQVIECDYNTMELVRGQSQVGRWIDRGLAGALDDAQDAIEWNSQAAKAESVIDPRFVHVYPDGSKVSVLSVTHPENPFHAFSPTGIPVTLYSSTRFGMMAMISVDISPGQQKYEYFKDHKCFYQSVGLMDNGTRMSIGIATGPWKSSGIIKPEKMTLNFRGAQYGLRNITKLYQRGDGRVLDDHASVEFTQPLHKDIELCLVAVSKSGEEEPREILTGLRVYDNDQTERPRVTNESYRWPMDQIDYFEFRTRDIIWHSFENVATAPDMSKEIQAGKFATPRAVQEALESHPEWFDSNETPAK